MNNEQWIVSEERRQHDRSIASLGYISCMPLLAGLRALHAGIGEGSFIYTQPRVGHKGIPFNIRKIRTLHTNTELRTSLGARDPAATKLGGVLRTINLDEVPQLRNIIDGDMRFVGPRPLLALDIETMKSELPRTLYDEWEHAYMSSVPGGISSFAISTRRRIKPTENLSLHRAHCDINDFNLMSRSYETSLYAQVATLGLEKIGEVFNSLTPPRDIKNSMKKSDI